MAHHHLGWKHRHKRTAREQRSKLIAALDDITFAVGIIGPLTVIPQVARIFTLQTAEGVSIATWALISLINIPWIAYAFAHKSKPLIANFIL